jgi:hypothetical protein
MAAFVRLAQLLKAQAEAFEHSGFGGLFDKCLCHIGRGTGFDGCDYS